MVRGGASGSPIFVPKIGRVVGTVFASVNQPTVVFEIPAHDGENPEEQAEPEPIGFVKLPTAFSFAVPSHYLSYFLNDEIARENYCPPDDALTIEEMLAGEKKVNIFDSDSGYTPLFD